MNTVRYIPKEKRLTILPNGKQPYILNLWDAARVEEDVCPGHILIYNSDNTLIASAWNSKIEIVEEL